MGEDILVCAECNEGFGEYGEFLRCWACGEYYCRNCMEDEADIYGVNEDDELKMCSSCDPSVKSLEDSLKEYLTSAIGHLKAVLDVTGGHDMDLFDEWKAADAFVREVENGGVL